MEELNKKNNILKEVKMRNEYLKNKYIEHSISIDSKNTRKSELYYFKNIDEAKALRIFKKLQNYVTKIITPDYSIWEYKKGVVTKIK
jgi:hypothetical protein